MNKTNSKWTLYAHQLDNDEWNISSFENIQTIDTIETAIVLLEKIFENNDVTCIYYMMRDNYIPLWDMYKDGCRYIYKEPRLSAINMFKELSFTSIGETLIYNNINTIGVSISPKFKNASVSVWFENTENIRYQTINKYSQDIAKVLISYNTE